MFTSRAEFRLSLREDNADLRLTEKGRFVGLVTTSAFFQYEKRKKSLQNLRTFLSGEWLKPNPELQSKLEMLGTTPLSYPQSLAQLLKRPELGLSEVLSLVEAKGSDWESLDDDSRETAEIEIKYDGYIEMQRQEIERLRKMKGLDIPVSLEYAEVVGLSFEVREKLARTKPRTLGDAARISGVTPAGLTALLFHIRQRMNGNDQRVV